MRDFLTKQEIAVLKEGHHAAQSRRSADRIKTVLLLNEGYSFGEIAKILLLDDTTIRRHVVLYKEHGIDGLLESHYQGSVGFLTPEQEAELTTTLRKDILTSLFQYAF
jgi:transposase